MNQSSSADLPSCVNSETNSQSFPYLRDSYNNVRLYRCSLCLERREFLFQRDVIRHYNEYHQHNLQGHVSKAADTDAQSYLYDNAGNVIVYRCSVCYHRAEFLFRSDLIQHKKKCDTGGFKYDHVVPNRVHVVRLPLPSQTPAETPTDMATSNTTIPAIAYSEVKAKRTRKKTSKCTPSRRRRNPVLKKIFHCDLCRTKLLQPLDPEPLRIKHKVYPARCSDCEGKSKDLDLHIVIQALYKEKVYKCGICSTSNKTLSIAMTHLRLHVRDKPYKIRASKNCYIVQKTNRTRRHSDLAAESVPMEVPADGIQREASDPSSTSSVSAITNASQPLNSPSRSVPTVTRREVNVDAPSSAAASLSPSPSSSTSASVTQLQNVEGQDELAQNSMHIVRSKTGNTGPCAKKTVSSPNLVKQSSTEGGSNFAYSSSPSTSSTQKLPVPPTVEDVPTGPGQPLNTRKRVDPGRRRRPKTVLKISSTLWQKKD